MPIHRLVARPKCVGSRGRVWARDWSRGTDSWAFSVAFVTPSKRKVPTISEVLSEFRTQTNKKILEFLV